MNECNDFGCGRFSESEWSELVAPVDPGTSESNVLALRRHIPVCAPCQAEWNAFSSLTATIGEAVRPRPGSREAFIDSVLATAERAREGLPRERHETKRIQDGRATPAAGHATSAIGRWMGAWRWLPRPVAAAAVLAMLAVLGAGLWSGPWSQTDPLVGGSTGEVLPGGRIVSVSSSPVASAARAGALRADGAAVSTAGESIGGIDGDESDRAIPGLRRAKSYVDSVPTAAQGTIRVTLGVRVETSGDSSGLRGKTSGDSMHDIDFE